MPNTAISVQASMTLIASNETGVSRLSEVEQLFAHVGETLAIEEAQMQAATVLCASGIAFWLRLIRANTQGGVQLGFESEVALKIATQTAYGAARLLIESGNHPEAEIDRVTTPSGCTITGLNVMEHSGMSSAFIQGLTASSDKINEIKSTT
jgi:pyrroline-5-carboxylate reductase